MNMFVILHVFLPGHETSVEHNCVLFSDPTQASPAGFSLACCIIVLVLILSPLPQVTLHSDHCSSHSPHKQLAIAQIGI